jgi:hypothetical protein
MEIEICSQCRGLVLDPGETVFAISNELDPLGEVAMKRSLSTLKVKFILYVVLGLVMLQFYTLWYFFG